MIRRVASLPLVERLGVARRYVRRERLEPMPRGPASVPLEIGPTLGVHPLRRRWDRLGAERQTNRASRGARAAPAPDRRDFRGAIRTRGGRRGRHPSCAPRAGSSHCVRWRAGSSGRGPPCPRSARWNSQGDAPVCRRRAERRARTRADARMMAEHVDHRSRLTSRLLAHAARVAPAHREVLPQQQSQLHRRPRRDRTARYDSVHTEKVEVGADRGVRPRGRLVVGFAEQPSCRSVARAFEIHRLAVDREDPTAPS